MVDGGDREVSYPGDFPFEGPGSKPHWGPRVHSFSRYIKRKGLGRPGPSLQPSEAYEPHIKTDIFLFPSVMILGYFFKRISWWRTRNFIETDYLTGNLIELTEKLLCADLNFAL